MDVHKIGRDYPLLMERIIYLADKRLVGENQLLTSVLDETAGTGRGRIAALHHRSSTFDTRFDKRIGAPIPEVTNATAP